MEIRKELPPNITDILKVFGHLKDFNPVFAYGNILYNPTGLPISQDLMVHEETHEKQQEALGVDQWWAMYLESPSFRLEQEAEAYKAQYQFLCSVLNRHGRQEALNSLSETLASSLYGNIINKKQAKELING